MTTISDDLTATVHSALTALDPVRKAEFLLDTALALIKAGKYVIILVFEYFTHKLNLVVGMVTTLNDTSTSISRLQTFQKLV